MATVTKPIALDESFNTTEVTPRNIADVLAEELGRLGSKTASDVEYDNTDSGLVAENVQDALDEINGKVVQSDWEQADPTKDDYIKNKPTTDLQTAVDSFSTLTGGLLSEAKLTLSPVQDLHGYDKPWSGGSGKNLLPPFSPFTESGITATVASDGTITLNGTATANINKQVPVNAPAGDYCLSLNNNATVGTSAATSVYFYAVDAGGSWVMNPICTVLNAFGRGTSANGITVVRMVINSGVTLNNFVIKPQLESGSTATSFEPYSNICPITGHTEVDIDVSDGQTTESYVINLGGTYYWIEGDAVSGEWSVIGEKRTYSWGTYSRTDDLTNTRRRILATISDALGTDSSALGTNLTDITVEQTGWTSDTPHFYIDNGNKTFVVFLPKDVPDSTDIELMFKYATPIPLTLIPQLIQTLVGENNLSAPLDGQTIDEVKYRQVFTFEDVVNYINGQGA